MSRTENRRETRVYDLDYFSGSQMFLYIGDVWIDEVTSLEYRIENTKQPIYGYASQLYDDMAAGQILVRGRFTINFKEQGYLWAVLQRYYNQGYEANFVGPPSPVGPLSDKFLESQSKLNTDAYRRSGGMQNNSSRPVMTKNATAIGRASIERVMQGNASPSELSKFYHGMAAYATSDVSNPRDAAFEALAEAFEDQVWVTGDNDVLNSQIRRVDEQLFDGFDIYVVFGNYAEPKANHTVQKIIGVNINAWGKTIEINGLPIQEQYEFIAKTVA